MSDWQTWAAPTVVILTVAVMIWRAKRKKKRPHAMRIAGVVKAGSDW